MFKNGGKGHLCNWNLFSQLIRAVSVHRASATPLTLVVIPF